MQINYDKQADAQYIRLKRGVVHTTEPQNEWLFFDKNRKEEIVGIEILGASKNKLSIVIDGDDLVHWDVFNPFSSKNPQQKEVQRPSIKEDRGLSLRLQEVSAVPA